MDIEASWSMMTYRHSAKTWTPAFGESPCSGHGICGVRYKLASHLIPFVSYQFVAKPENSRSLLRALFQCVRRQMLAAVVPRLFLIGFRYSQPVLIRQSIKYVTAPPQSAGHTYGYWLSVTAMAIYAGLAVSTISISIAFSDTEVDFQCCLPTSTEQSETRDKKCSCQPHSSQSHESAYRHL